MLPTAAGRFYVSELWSLSVASSGLALASAFLGLLLSCHLDLPSGPAIIFVAGWSISRLSSSGTR
jgi:zinc/manganese transport system permease protein